LFSDKKRIKKKSNIRRLEFLIKRQKNEKKRKEKEKRSVCYCRQMRKSTIIEKLGLDEIQMIISY